MFPSFSCPFRSCGQAKKTLTGRTTCEVVVSGLMRTRRLAAKRKKAQQVRGCSLQS
nr:MAG TPA: hypothetical protein [Caudoviricetes sp.]